MNGITATGTIKRVKIDSGFGFIARGEGLEDVFFHVCDLAPDLDWDETLTERHVRFEIVETAKGPRAANVRPAA